MSDQDDDLLFTRGSEENILDKVAQEDEEDGAHGAERYAPGRLLELAAHVGARHDARQRAEQHAERVGEAGRMLIGVVDRVVGFFC